MWSSRYTVCLTWLILYATEGVTRPQVATSELEPTWKEAPKERETWGLVLSCALTIGLAVWGSLLLNVQMVASETTHSITKAIEKKQRRSRAWLLWSFLSMVASTAGSTAPDGLEV